MIDRLHPARIGLALGGGGARGLAHLGLLKVLDRERIPIYGLAGTSMGGLIAAAYARGFTPDEIEVEITQLAQTTRLLRLADRIPTFSGLFKGTRFHGYLASHIGADTTFGELKCPLALTAVDLTSGQEVVLDAGSVVGAMRATMSIPGVYQAVKMGRMRLVDGGVLNNVPVDPARRLGARRVIAVDVLPDFSANNPQGPTTVSGMELPLMGFIPPIARDLWEVVQVAISAMTARRLAESPPDVLLRPEIPLDVSLLIGFTRAEEIIAAGEAAAEAALPEIRRIVEEAESRDGPEQQGVGAD